MSAEKQSSLIQAIRLWKVESGILKEIEKGKLDLEEKLEEWIALDASIISSNLIIIGRQVSTDFGGAIDLLGMEENGDIVIIELKRDKTPRDIVAQVLDYASWVKDLTAEQIQNIADKYLKDVGDIGFEEAYQKKFNHDLPDSINEQHKMLVIGSEIDSGSLRIINYLSKNYDVGINAITFNYFKDGFIARTFLIEPTTQIVKKGTRLQNLTEEQLQRIAEEKGVGEIYSYLVTGLTRLFDSKGTTRSSLAFSGLQDGKMNTIFSLLPPESSAEEGLKFKVYSKRFSKFFSISEDEPKMVLPENKKEWIPYPKSNDPEYRGYEGFFKELNQAEDFLKKLRKSQK
ncbi:MAG: endonuclease NucS [Candidatus Bathyarchaeota archaeon]|nr:endonuclease NucS [Candidatus Bathyarchaeota archaeon]